MAIGLCEHLKKKKRTRHLRKLRPPFCKPLRYVCVASAAGTVREAARRERERDERELKRKTKEKKKKNIYYVLARLSLLPPPIFRASFDPPRSKSITFRWKENPAKDRNPKGKQQQPLLANEKKNRLRFPITMHDVWCFWKTEKELLMPRSSSIDPIRALLGPYFNPLTWVYVHSEIVSNGELITFFPDSKTDVGYVQTICQGNEKE